MKHIATLCSVLLVALVLAAPAPVRAESVTFVGKAYCSIRAEIKWPFLSLNQLRIVSAPVKVGQHVTEKQRLITYELPLESRITEKRKLDHTKVDSLERALALVDFQLAELRQKQDDLENMVASQSIAPNVPLGNLKAIEALRLRRESVAEQLDLARSEYKDKLTLAQTNYGDSISDPKAPREGLVLSPIDGHVLWVNSSLVHGMVFISPADLITIGRMDPMVVRAAVHEIAAQRLKDGEKADVVFHALPGEIFRGTVTNISYTAQPATMQQPTFYEIEITIPNKEMRIKEGMRCDITIDLP